MVCPNCGKERKDNVRVCPRCGALTSPGDAPVVPEGGSTGGWSEPDRQKRGGLITGGAAAAVIVAGIIAAVSLLFSSPKGRLEKALTKSFSAYAEARKDLGLPELADLMELGRNGPGSRRFSVEVRGISRELTGGHDLSALQGIGMRVNSGWDLKDRKMDADMAVFWNDEDLMSLRMLADGAEMYFSSPDFTKGAAYGFNTETLGADLDRLGVDGGNIDLKKIGFNFFDLLEITAPSGQQAEDTEKALEEAYKELFNSAGVEKAGTESIQVNGSGMDADVYHVVIPQDALEAYVNALTDALNGVDTEEMMREILQAMGFDAAAIDGFILEMNSADICEETAGLLSRAAESIGDAELEVYVSGGYVVAAESSRQIEGVMVEIGLYWGGGDNYVDDFSMEISAGGEELLLKSSGAHAGQNGAFTDVSTICMRSNGSDAFRATSDLRYEPDTSDGNFEWELELDSAVSIRMEGRLEAGRDSIDLSLEDVSLSAAGTELLSLAADYYLGPCDGVTASVSSPKMLSDMDGDDLRELYCDIQNNTVDWVYGVLGRVPADLYYYLF